MNVHINPCKYTLYRCIYTVYMRDQWEYTSQLKISISPISDNNQMTAGLVKTHGCLIFVKEVMEECSKNYSHCEKTVLRLETHCHHFNSRCVFPDYCNKNLIVVEQTGIGVE